MEWIRADQHKLVRSLFGEIMQVQSLKAHRYANRQLKAGDRYDIKPQDLRLARALGWVGDVAPAAPKVVVAKVVAPKVETTGAEETGRPTYLPSFLEGERVKRKYTRRDLTAEE